MTLPHLMTHLVTRLTTHAVPRPMTHDAERYRP